MDGYTPRQLAQARRFAALDPAVDEEDLLQSGFLKTLGHAFVNEEHRERTLALAVRQAGIDVARRRGRRRELPIADWTPSGEDVERETLARLALEEVVATATGGDVVAREALLLGAGYAPPEVQRLLGVPKTTLWRARRKRKEGR